MRLIIAKAQFPLSWLDFTKHFAHDVNYDPLTMPTKTLCLVASVHEYNCYSASCLLKYIASYINTDSAKVSCTCTNI